MKTIAFALSVLTTSIFTANANDLAAFLEYTKTYTVSFSDGVSYDRVTFKRFAKGSNAADISHPTNGTRQANDRRQERSQRPFRLDHLEKPYNPDGTLPE